MNARNKGKRGELYFVNELKDIWPEASRNYMAQAADGGVDIVNTKPFNLEVKVGKQGNIKKIHDWLEQVKTEGREFYHDAVLVKPDREDAYVVMPFEDFKAIVETMVAEGIIKP